jgi:hypothetical protein
MKTKEELIKKYRKKYQEELELSISEMERTHQDSCHYKVLKMAKNYEESILLILDSIEEEYYKKK